MPRIYGGFLPPSQISIIVIAAGGSTISFDFCGFFAICDYSVSAISILDEFFGYQLFFIKIKCRFVAEIYDFQFFFAVNDIVHYRDYEQCH